MEAARVRVGRETKAARSRFVSGGPKACQEQSTMRINRQINYPDGSIKFARPISSLQSKFYRAIGCVSRMIKNSLHVVRKTRCISDKMSGRKSPKSIDTAVLSRIYGGRRGPVFTPTRFLDLGTRAAIDKSLSRLARAGTVRRLARGLYDYPKTHPTLGLLSPSADQIALALAQPAKAKIQASGAYAANLLGLSEQVPMKTVFLTTGTPRRVRIGRREIILKRTTPRQMMAAGRTSGLIIQAFRHLGKQHINQNRVDLLKRKLTFEDKTRLLKDMPLAPTWMHSIFRKIAAD